MNNNTNPTRDNLELQIELKETLVCVIISLLKKLILKTSEPKKLGIKLCLDS